MHDFNPVTEEYDTNVNVTFPAKEITTLGRYQIILLGDRGTQV